MQRVELLSVPIDPLRGSEAVSRIKQMPDLPGQFHVMTPNAEMLVEASRNPVFLSLLKKSDLNLADSVGLLYAARYTGQSLPERVTGVDTVTRLCATLPSEHTVFLLGAAPGIAGRAAAVLEDLNPRLTIAGTYAGSPSEEEASAIVSLINRAQPHVLLVAYGAPAQDLWIDRHLSEMSSVKVAIGVGGTFDFLAGTAKRAPGWMRALGLEWLWRVILQPSRLPRIIRATILFPYLILRFGRRAASPSR